MRPVCLEVEGFTAFRGATTVDFTDVDLFALVGPTGAGKTSVIDAITFALYGSVPRLDDRRAVAPVVSQNLNEARVRLDFTVDGVAHAAVRVVRATKSGGATTKEARLERAGEVLAGTADEVTAAVTERLGLSFEHFTTCVSLPQGQFARFLHDKPRSRQDLLVRLLDLGLYDQVAGAARQRGALARNRADVVAGQLDRLADATPEARRAAAARVDELGRLGERLAAARPEIDRLAAAVADAGERAAAVEADVGRLDALAAPDGVDALAAELVAADEARARAAQTDDEAVAAVADAEARVADLPDRRVLDALLADHRRRAELVESIERGAAAEAESADFLATATAAENAARGARDERVAALERVRVEMRAQALVPELAVGEPCPVCRRPVDELPDGHHAPDLVAAERTVAGAETALTEAADAVTGARTRQARVDEKLVRVRAELTALDERLAASAAALGPRGLDGAARRATAVADRPGGSDGSGAAEAAGDHAAEPAGDVAGTGAGVPDAAAVEVALAAVTDADAGLTAARQAEREARRARATADRHHAALVDREREARRAFDAARDAVAALAPPAPDRRDLAEDWRALLGWAAEQRPVLAASAAEQRRRAGTARADAAGRLDVVLAACRDLGVEVPPAVPLPSGPESTRGRASDASGTTGAGPGGMRRTGGGTRRTGGGTRRTDPADTTGAADPADVPDAVAALVARWPGEAVAAARARAEEAVGRIDAQLAEAERLRGDADAATAEQQVADSLAGHLAANRFEKWLLDEAMHQLVAGASIILGDLSGGAYALDIDTRSGGFLVVDHTNASQVRPARTLSGGETFLASLALALALADQVAGLAAAGTARLETLFLDEGFGTLDPDTLDVVATALDELGAGGRMVGVVTHVRDLAERLPVRFEVRKVGGAAAVERVEA